MNPHVERHFMAGKTVRDIIIGMSDGLTVPFALAAGLSGAIMATGIVVKAGFAEIAAGSISMGLGGYLAARSEHDHYEKERAEESREVREEPEHEANEVLEIFEQYGVQRHEALPIVEAFKKNPEHWIDFMMQLEHGFEKPESGRAIKSAMTIAGAYIVGGLVPLLPYLLIHTINTALAVSVGVTAFALFIFGAVKGRVMGIGPLRSGLATFVIGGVAACAAFFIAQAIG